MSSESERVKTFNNDNWPHCFISPIAFAKAGFEYMGILDRVRCVYCNVRLCDWKKGDDVFIDHKIHSPECPLVKNNYNPHNIPLYKSASSSSTAGDYGGTTFSNFMEEHLRKSYLIYIHPIEPIIIE